MRWNQCGKSSVWLVLRSLILVCLCACVSDVQVQKKAETPNVHTYFKAFMREFGGFEVDSTRNSFNSLKIATVPFDVNKFFVAGQEEWKSLESYYKLSSEDHDPRNDELKEVDFSKVTFLPVLKSEKDGITRMLNGEDKLELLKRDNTVVRYGATVFMGLWVDYQIRKKDSVLATLHLTYHITFIDFLGDIMLTPSDSRHVLYLYACDGGKWDWGVCHISYDDLRGGRIPMRTAVSSLPK